MPLFAIVYRKGPGWKASLPMERQDLRDHFLYLRGLNETGVVVVAGPLGADGGLVIARAADLAAASKVIADDPAVVAGVFAGEARPFLPRIGGAQPLVSPVR